MEEDRDILELVELWDSLTEDAKVNKKRFREKLLELNQNYSMSELSLLTGINRTTLYYHRGRVDGD